MEHYTRDEFMFSKSGTVAPFRGKVVPKGHVSLRIKEVWYIIFLTPQKDFWVIEKKVAKQNFIQDTILCARYGYFAFCNVKFVL